MERVAMIAALFRRDPLKDRADALYLRVSSAAREPALFARHRVPDTVEGRFEALVLHVFLLARRLDRLGPEGSALAQAFIDRFFLDLDGAVRAIGIGDLSVGKKVKAFARAFYGRVEVYEAGLAPGAADGALEEALARNLLGGAEGAAQSAPAIARFVRESAKRLDALALADVAAAQLFETDVLA
jgi:cytochrome b pre-mRNA-processing protein 3